MKPQSPHLKSIIRTAQITCACLETLKTHPHFTEVPTGMRWLPCYLLLQSIWKYSLSLGARKVPGLPYLLHRGYFFLFLEEQGNEHRLITLTMPYYATAQEVWQTPRLGFLTSSIYVDSYVCASHPNFPSLQAEIGTPRAQFI